MRALPRSVLLVACVVLAGPARAEPVFTQATLTVVIDYGFPIAPFEAHGSGFIDVTGSTVTVPAGIVSLGQRLVVPVTSSTIFGVVPLTARTLSNLSGTFSLGGVTAQAPAEVCGAGPAVGEACNAGGGIGGTMRLDGTIFWPYGIVVIPLAPLGNLPLGEGGSTNIPFTADGAAWSTGGGVARGPERTTTRVGSGSPFNLVTPVYVDALGNQGFIWASLVLTAVSLPIPEPGLLALVAGCALGFWVCRR